jgi:peptidoglycan/xylan/chitin deacetylase (PgdA/CDA1 family)
MESGKFIISLDFELMWGVRDKKSIASYGSNIVGVHKVIPKLLELFNDFEIAATFSTVGFLFFKNKQELQKGIPEFLPDYLDQNLSPYKSYINLLQNIDQDDYHFAPELINKIKDYPQHEIGSHTFSHYYCLEPGQNLQSFEQDVKAAKKIAEANNISFTSLVFPRNQCNDDYLNVCHKYGIICYRGAEKSWIYDPKNGEDETLFRRLIRLTDSYINLSGHHTYNAKDISKQNVLVNLPASRFLRPYNKKLKLLESLRLRRILKSMNYAAKNKQIFHLWWHPHNFGINQDQNLQFLNKILVHYQKLKSQYRFDSITMSNMAKHIIHEQ